MIGLYQELSDEITLIKIRIKDLEVEHKRLRKMMFHNSPQGLTAIDYSKDRVQNSFSPYPLDVILQRMNAIETKIEPLYSSLEEKENTINEIRQAIEKMDGLDHKVAYMKTIEGKTLVEISIELGYSYDWIREVNSRILKQIKTHNEPTKQLI